MEEKKTHLTRIEGSQELSKLTSRLDEQWTGALLKQISEPPRCCTVAVREYLRVEYSVERLAQTDMQPYSCGWTLTITAQGEC